MAKGVSVYVSWVIILVIIVIGIALVLGSGLPVIESSKSSLSLTEAEQFLAQLDSSIREVSQEGIGSSRLLRVPAGDYRLVDNGVEFRTLGSFFEPLSRKIVGNLLAFGGSDVSCSEQDFGGTPALKMENTFISIFLQKVDGSIDTADNILIIQSKAANATITPADTSIVIDGDPASSSGTGFSELTRSGTGLPLCRARFSVNSTAGIDYDIFYTLYSGADFIQVDVRNIES